MVTHPPLPKPRALPFRSVAFHQGRIEPGALAQSARLGANVMELHVEGDTMRGLHRLRERADREGFLAEARDLGMGFALWTHELSSFDEAQYGPPEVDNERVWELLRERYHYVCTELFPELDYLVLTVVETQLRMTSVEPLRRVIEALHEPVRAAGKQLIFRSFVWHPEEEAGVVKAMENLPEDVWLHTKYVPQDWHFRSIDNPLIGRFPRQREIVEHGIAGEYLRERHLPACVARDLATRHQRWLARGAQGVAIRVNRIRDDNANSAFHSLQESNLWVMLPLACGEDITVDEGLHRYATHYLGDQAAPIVAPLLAEAGEVALEALCVGPETFGDPRSDRPGDRTLDREPEEIAVRYEDDEDNHGRNPFHRNWSVWRWDETYQANYQRLRRGDPELIAAKELSYHAARERADSHLRTLEAEAWRFAESSDLAYLQWRYAENRWHLDAMCHAALLWMRTTRILYSDNPQEQAALRRTCRQHLDTLAALHEEALSTAAAITWKGHTEQAQRGSYLDLKAFREAFLRIWGHVLDIA